MTARFYETHFEDYLNTNDKRNLHPKISDNVYSKLPENVESLPNIIIYYIW